MIIHTTAPIAPLVKLVGDRGNVTVGTAIRTGGPDCFAGWFEPADRDDCQPNNLVTVESASAEEDLRVTTEIAMELFEAGQQVVVTATNHDGDEEILEDGTVPIRYQMKHTH